MLGGLFFGAFLIGWFAFMTAITYVIGRCIYEMVVDTILVLLRKPEKFDKRPLNRPPFHIWGPPPGGDSQ